MNRAAAGLDVGILRTGFDPDIAAAALGVQPAIGHADANVAAAGLDAKIAADGSDLDGSPAAGSGDGTIDGVETNVSAAGLAVHAPIDVVHRQASAPRSGVHEPETLRRHDLVIHREPRASGITHARSPDQGGIAAARSVHSKFLELAPGFLLTARSYPLADDVRDVWLTRALDLH